MEFKLKVTRKITVNGKEYASADELPLELRKRYEAALAGGQGEPPKSTRIVFNGTEYDSPEHMPPEVRRLYDLAVAAAGNASAAAPSATGAEPGTQGLPPPPAPSMAPGLRPPKAAPGSGSSSKLVFWLAAAAVLVALWTFFARHGTRLF
jgi:hypothetical protein